MKIVKINDYEIDIIKEKEEYIDIYTFIETCHNDLMYQNEYNDEGKGWRLFKLTRINKKTKGTIEMECIPDLNSYNNYFDANISFTHNGVRYKRLLVINRENYIDYVAQDIITSTEEHTMSDEFISYILNYKKKNEEYYELYFKLLEKSKENTKLKDELEKRKFPAPNYKKFIDIKPLQTIKIDLTNNKYTLFTTYRDYSCEETEPFRSYEQYINDNKTECEYLPYSTNDLLLDFNEMNSKLRLYGYPGEKVEFYENTSSKGFKKVKKKQIYSIK